MQIKNNIEATVAQSRIAPEELRWKCHLDSLPFETTAEIDPAKGVLGQPTAYEALKFGIECMAPGQNVYVRGARGTGRITMVRTILNELRPHCDTKRDFCYVHNFTRPDHPRLITLGAGLGGKFRRQMMRVADFVSEGLTKSLDSEPHLSNRQAIQEKLQAEIHAVTESLEKDIEANGLRLVNVQQGPASQTLILPVVDGEPVPAEQLKLMVSQGQAPPEQLKQYEELLPKYRKQLQETSRAVNKLIRDAQEFLRQHNEEVARGLLSATIAPVLEDFPGEDVKKFLDQIVEDFIENHLQGEDTPNFKELYGVNVVLTHGTDDLRPVVEENNPTLLNLLGTVEPKFGPGGLAVSDYRGIRAGALLQADSGYLILDANELIAEPGAYRALMRTLRTGRLEIVPPELGMMRQTVVTVPQPIEVQVRVILIGDASVYYQLDAVDPDFGELFKVLADFDSELPRNDNTLQQYASVVAGLSQSESLPAFHRSAVGALAEHGARIVARQGRLTSRFGRIADVAREAAYLAGDQNVTSEHVYDAVRRTKARASMPSTKFFEMVKNRTIMVETEGSVVGQINGLAVMKAGPLTYGFPARITASIGPGSAGLINVEGRARMSGSIHTKGFQILGGLLRYLLRTDHPMAFSASIAFEQSYGGIDGDSASGAEIICLLSALSKIPVKQSMAITGAIDQHGHLEAIGGVNEKIEGFFDACSYFGLTGDQGVVIPKSNAGDLMLRQDIVEAAEAGMFHVYAVDNIHDAMELMTGVEAGQLDENGEYPDGTLLATAHDQVESYWRRSFANPTAFQTASEQAEAELAAAEERNQQDSEEKVAETDGEAEG